MGTKIPQNANSLEMSRLTDSLSFLYAEDFEIKAITSGFKTDTITVYSKILYTKYMI